MKRETDPYQLQKKRINDFREQVTEKISAFNETNLKRDIDLVDKVYSDLCTLGFDFKKPTVRVFRDEKFIRIYGLEYFGGIALVYEKGESFTSYTLFTLSEDDGTYYCYPMGWRLYEPMVTYSHDAASFVNLLSEVLSTFNSIEK